MTKQLTVLTFGALLAAGALVTPACSSDETSDDAGSGGSSGAGSAGKSGGAGKSSSAGKSSGSAGKSVSGGSGGSSAGKGGSGDGGAPDAGGTSGNAGDSGGEAANAGQPGAAGDPGSATGGSAGTAGTGGTDPGACNDIPIEAPEVHPVSIPFTGTLPPLPEGGDIVDGTYFLTKYEEFGIDAKPGTYEVVMKITGSELQLAQIVNGTEGRGTLELEVDGTHFGASSTCPSTGQTLSYDSYTATDDELVLFDDETHVTLTLQ